MRGFLEVREDCKKHQNNKIILPKRATKSSAGYDFYAPEKIIIAPKKSVKICTDVKAFMLSDEVLQIYPRSSIGLQNIMLTNSIGIIDSDYFENPNNDGNIIISLTNFGEKDFILNKNDRFAQGIFIKYLTTKDYEDGKRLGGFGHSGK